MTFIPLKIGCGISFCFIILGCIGFIAGAGLSDVMQYIAANVVNTAVVTIVLTITALLYDAVH